MTAPLLVAHVNGYVDLKLFFLFCEIAQPYAYVLLTFAHITFLVVLRNVLISNIIDLLSGNFLGSYGKSAIAKVSSFLLPKSYFDSLAASYHRYVKFLESFRRD
jgi:uncharacterized membrane protein YccC